MMEVIFGNKTVEKILLFLFVNGKCYGTQLHKQLKTPLTPLQKALLRLEKGGLITSYYEGKTRYYQFSPEYLLLEELQQLLKKAYGLLPADQKKDYSTIKEDSFSIRQNPAEALKVLVTFWNKLENVKRLSFEAKSKSKEGTGWNGKGQGEVTVTRPSEDVLIFQEKGNWKGKQKEDFGFHNTYRWTIDRRAGRISLEHLRLGMNRPVFLFHLTPISHYAALSVDAHHCSEDSYYGRLVVNGRGMRLHWRVVGPKKNEEIDYNYF